MNKNIVVIGLIIFILFMMSFNRNNKVAEEIVIEPGIQSQEEVIYQIITGDTISHYNQLEIVILYELTEHLYKSFQISYDDYKKVYNEFFYVGPDMDEIIMIGYESLGVHHFPKENFDELKGYNFIGLSVYESVEWLRSVGYEIDYEILLSKVIGMNRHVISISEPIKGYYDEDSTVYVRKEIARIGRAIISEDIHYTSGKYIFKEIDGQYKILSRTEGFGAVKQGHVSQFASVEKAANRFNMDLERFEERYTSVGVNEFAIVFDIRKFCDDYMNSKARESFN